MRIQNFKSEPPH